MRIQSLKINGFRNLSSLELAFDSSIDFLVFSGKNGQGKTNILEAIYLCALSKSFRTNKSHELICFNELFCHVQTRLDDGLFLEFIVTDPSQKVLKVNGIKKSALDFVGQLKAVFFSPDDLAHMAFAPRLRRRYLDVLLSQLHHDYLEALIYYESARTRRNALLRQLKLNQGSLDELIYWDGLLAQYAMPLKSHRNDLILKMQPLLRHYYGLVSGDSHFPVVHYLTEIAQIQSEEDYLKHLASSRQDDVASGKTGFGPQRDDLQFSLRGKDMRFFASRGEWRTLVLALKLAEIQMLKEKTESAPILLLDDVFSELDEDRQVYLLKAIEGVQTFITTTNTDFFASKKIPHKRYSVQEGRVFEP